MTDHSVTEEVRTQAAHRSTMVSVWVNILLSLLQLTVGILSKSQALIADAVHSFSDLIADGIVLWANKYSAKAPDDDHPYGHRRFETAATFAVGAILRSEEHTSELQSRFDLVCRLLLEKKKHKH